IFDNNSTGDSAVVNNNGTTVAGGNGANMTFQGNAKAANIDIFNNGSAFGGTFAGGFVNLTQNATADSITIFNEAGTASGGSGGYLRFGNSAGAANATVQNFG